MLSFISSTPSPDLILVFLINTKPSWWSTMVMALWKSVLRMHVICMLQLSSNLYVVFHVSSGQMRKNWTYSAADFWHKTIASAWYIHVVSQSLVNTATHAKKSCPLCFQFHCLWFLSQVLTQCAILQSWKNVIKKIFTSINKNKINMWITAPKGPR